MLRARSFVSFIGSLFGLFLIVGGLFAPLAVRAQGVAPTAELRITSTALPPAIIGTPYTARLTATGGSSYAWRWGYLSGLRGATDGSGIQLGENGTFSGTPTTAGTTNVRITVRDERGREASRDLTLTVTAAGAPPETTTPSPASEPVQPTNNTPRPFQPIVPNPSVPIPGVTFTPASEEGGLISIPYLAQYISGIYRLSVGLGAILAAVMIVFGGFKYMLAASAPEVTDGKTIIIDAVVGLVVLLTSFLILKTINPKLVEMNPIRVSRVETIPISEDSAYDSLALAADPENGGGSTGTGAAGAPTTFCRQNLAATPSGNHTVWCAACQPAITCGTRIIGGPDPACPALIGSCGGSYGKFLASVTGNCSGKTFRSLEGLDGGTFGILGHMQQDFPALMQILQRKDPAVYSRVMAAGNNRDISRNALCSSNQNDRGFICNADYRRMLETALPTRAFALAQLEYSYRKYIQRVTAAATHGFRSSFGQAMWATAANNPGRCGATFSLVREACAHVASASESERIDCFLEKFVTLGCRGGTVGAQRRVASIRQELRGVSRTDSVAPPTLQQLEACVPAY